MVPYSYLANKNSLNNKNIINLVRTNKFGNQCTIPVCYTFHDVTVNKPYINPYIIYPKYKVEFSLASLFVSYKETKNSNRLMNQLIKEEPKDIENYIKIYTSTQTIKYINKSEIQDYIDEDETYGNYRIIWRNQDNKLSDPQILEPNEIYLPRSLKALKCNDENEDKAKADMLLQYFKNNIDIIKNVIISSLKYQNMVFNTFLSLKNY